MDHSRSASHRPSLPCKWPRFCKRLHSQTSCAALLIREDSRAIRMTQQQQSGRGLLRGPLSLRSHSTDSQPGSIYRNHCPGPAMMQLSGRGFLKQPCSMTQGTCYSWAQGARSRASTEDPAASICASTMAGTRTVLLRLQCLDRDPFKAFSPFSIVSGSAAAFGSP